MAPNNNTNSDPGDRPSVHHEPQGNSSGETQESSFYFAKVDHNSQDTAPPEDYGDPTTDFNPGFAYVDGTVNGDYDDTQVDVITVTCPGADPLRPWVGSELFSRVSFQLGLEVASHLLPRLGARFRVNQLVDPDGRRWPANKNVPTAWVTFGIRTANPTARVLLYRHRTPRDGLTMMDLADDLMREIVKVRQGLHSSRPLFFLGHSIGGLVVKMLLVKASTSETSEYKQLMHNCHGVAFFGTPHRGSSYMSMLSLSESIKTLLHLERPLPQSLTNDLRVNDERLLKLNDDFKAISSELRLWTFYETKDSQLSGTGAGLANEVRFGAPLASIKSTLLDFWEEDICSVDSDHANCASFPPNNSATLFAFLEVFSEAISKAAMLRNTHHSLDLKRKVEIDITGFYADPEAPKNTRLYFARPLLAECLEKGPEACLKARLSKVHEHGRQGADMQIQESVVRPAPTTSSSMPAAVMRGIHSLTSPGLSRSSSCATVSTAASEPIFDSQKETGAILDDEQASVSTSKKEAVREIVRADIFARTSPRQDIPAGFSRPTEASRKFMWIHSPFLNPLWVKDIIAKLAETHHRDYSRLLADQNWASKHVRGRHSQSQPSFVKPACGRISLDAVPPPQASHASDSSSPAQPISNCVHLFMPYLHFDTYSNVIRRRNLIKRRLNHGRAGPVPEQISLLKSLESRVTWEHICSDPPLNCRRTLDQYGYSGLHDTFARDDDQMLYKLTKKEQHLQSAKTNMRTAETHRLFSRTWTSGNSPSTGLIRTGKVADSDEEFETYPIVEEEVEKIVREGNVLMVDQLWLWAIDTKTLVTFFPKRESLPREGPLFKQADLRDTVYNELNGDLTDPTDNALDLAAFIVFHSVTLLLEHYSNADLEIFRIFEEAIGMLTEKMTTSLKAFRMQTFQELVAGVSVSDFETDDDPGNSNSKSIKKRYKRELEKAQRENRENTSALLELRDMEDELSTMMKLFETQDSTIKSMMATYHDVGADWIESNGTLVMSNGTRYLRDALAKLEEYKSITTEMIKRVDTTRKDYEKLLEMAQRQAQVDDVRWSRIQTELASTQNLSVMIFTTFTVIFLPLSFFTGLFGMNTVEWQDQVPSLSFIGSISLPVSVVLIVGTLVAAFNERVQGWFMYLHRHWRRGRKWMRDKVQELTPDATKKRRKKKAAVRENRERREEKARSERKAYDFWGTIRKERQEVRQEVYRIPAVNRMGTEARR